MGIVSGISVFLVNRVFNTRYRLARWTRKYPRFGRLVKRIAFDGDDMSVLPKAGTAHVRVDLNIEVENAGERNVVPTDMIKNVLRRSEKIFIMDFCLCRQSNKCKDYPVSKGCIFIGKGTERISPKYGRFVTPEEACDYIDECDRLGQVAVSLSINKAEARRKWAEAISFGQRSPLHWEESSAHVGIVDSAPLSWDSQIAEDDLKVVNPEWLEDEVVEEPSKWDPCKELSEYLNILFTPEDIIGYCVNPFQKDDRWIPSRGVYDRTVSEILKELKKGRLDNALGWTSRSRWRSTTSSNCRAPASSTPAESPPTPSSRCSRPTSTSTTSVLISCLRCARRTACQLTARTAIRPATRGCPASCARAKSSS